MKKLLTYGAICVGGGFIAISLLGPIVGLGVSFAASVTAALKMFA